MNQSKDDEDISITEHHHNTKPDDYQYDHEKSDPSSPSLLQSYSFAGAVSLAGSIIEQKAEDARPLLPKAAFFMGDLRDGLPMVRSQSKFESFIFDR